MQYLKSHWPLLLVLPLFLLLLARNPFSQRTLIANFEPFPDSFHYLTTVRCWLAGEGWQLCREGRTVEPMVPPVYSLWLLPFLVVDNDPRMFYFANVAASLLGLILFYLLLKEIRLKRSSQFLLLLLFATNYYLYWLPTLAMAEVLLVPLFLLLLLCIVKPQFKWKLMGAVSIGLLYGTKYAAAPLVLSGGLVLLWQTWTIKNGRQRIPTLGAIIGTITLLLLFIKGPQFFTSLLGIGSVLLAGLVRPLLEQTVPQSAAAAQATQAVEANWAFSAAFIPLHFPEYLKLALGKSGLLLWKYVPLVPFLLGLLGLCGVIINLFVKKYRGLAFAILLLLFSQILFMSSFYSVDGRYVIIAIPSLLTGLALLIKQFENYLTQRRISFTIPFITVLGAMSILLLSATRLKFDVMLNLKYAETPWWYLSVVHLNNYFSQPQTDRPIMITAIPPYLVDFYSNGNYQLMPLSQDMDFRHMKKDLFGEYDFSDLPSLYQNLYQQGKALYVTPYGIGNVQQRNDDWAILQHTFELQPVAPGCYELCTIYEVTGIKKIPLQQ